MKTVSGLFLGRRPLAPCQCGAHHPGLGAGWGPSCVFHVGTQQNLRCPCRAVVWFPAVWGSRFPAHSKLPLGLASLMLWDSQLRLPRRVDWTPGDGAEFLERLLPAPGFLSATGVGSWSGRFLPFLPRSPPAPLKGDGDAVAGPSDSGTTAQGLWLGWPWGVGCALCPCCCEEGHRVGQ